MFGKSKISVASHHDLVRNSSGLTGTTEVAEALMTRIPYVKQKADHA